MTARLRLIYQSVLGGMPPAFPRNSGAAPLYLAAPASQLQPGDAVVVPAITFVATANAAVLAGFRRHHRGSIHACADRQHCDRDWGRLRAASTIDCHDNREAIIISLNMALSLSFRVGLTEMHSPYGEGGATKKAPILFECPS